MFLDSPTAPAVPALADGMAGAAPASPGPGGRDVPPFASPPWRVSDLLLGVGGLLGSLLVVFGLIGLAVALGAEGRDRDLWAAGATVGFEASLAGLVLLLARRRGIGLGELGLCRPARWGLLPAALIGAYVMLGLYQALLVLLEALGIDASALDGGNPLPSDADQGIATLALLGVAVVVAAPLGEELFFRGLLFRGLRGYWRVLPALALSGLLFGLFHVNPSVLVPFTAVGMVFAWAMEQSESLWIPIAAHAAFNSLAFAAHVAGA